MTERHDTQDSDEYERPSAWSRIVSNAGTLIVTAVMVGGIWWWAIDETQPKSDEAPKISESHPTADDSHSRSTNGDRRIERVAQLPSANGHAPPNGDTPAESTERDGVEFDASRTSWQDPFDASHWESDGWTFQPKGMRSNTTKSATARFRRDYRKITIECRVAPLGESGVFQIRLFAPTTDALMQVEFSREMVKVSSTIKRKQTLVKQRRFPVPFVVGKPTTLRLTATGNRVLVICNNTRVLSCSQPAEQSGKPLQFSFRTAGGAFQISSLGLEGE